jgi:hypothetical protein
MRDSKEESLIKRTVKASANAFKSIFLGSEVTKAVEEIKEEVESTIEQTKKKIDVLVDQLTARTLSFFLLLAGILFGFVGLYYFILEQTFLPRSTASIVVGIILLCIGWFSINAKK